jgi:ferritin-like metal-binding protein YciE
MFNAKRTLNLEFVGDDIRNQIDYGLDILKEIRALRSVVENTSDQAARSAIQSAIDGLLMIADRVSANVESTTTSAAAISSRVTSG